MADSEKRYKDYMIIYPFVSGKALGSPRRSWKLFLGRGVSGFLS